ncbi:tripartite tricarboxylate transporter substrate binding protein [Diaphorobacter sp. NR2-3-3-1]|nr:tripartite tricarboxylate transporter substrate binding protein [Diaphorobacter caeni]
MDRTLRWSVLGASVGYGWPALAQASYPRQAMKWIVPFPAGGGTDVVARLLAQSMSSALGQPMVVDNRPGAGTMIGGEAIARARPDGYTFGTVDVSTLALAPHLYARVPYRIQTDFSFIGGTTKFPFVLVVKPDFPARTLQDLISMARGKPETLKYASPGAGGPNHLGMELFQRQMNVRMIHVPYRGDAPALQDLLGGQIDMYLVNTAASLPYLQSGKLRALGVAMSSRIQALPDVPTFREAGVADFESYAWQGLAAPAGAPADVVARLNAELNKALALPEITKRLQDMGVEAMSTTPTEFAALVTQQAQLWGKVIREANVKLES